MDENDILHAIWDYRAAYAQRFNGDIDAMMEDLRLREGAEGRVVVRSVPEYQAARAQAEAQTQTQAPVPAHPPIDQDWWEIELAKDEFARRFGYDAQAMRQALRALDQTPTPTGVAQPIEPVVAEHP